MSLGHHHAWLPPGHLRPPPDNQNDARSVNGYGKYSSGARTPYTRASVSADGSQTGNLISDADAAPDEDPRVAMFRDLYKRSEAKINDLFNDDRTAKIAAGDSSGQSTESAPPQAPASRADDSAPRSAPVKKSSRKLDDDDYDDFDEDDEEDEVPQSAPFPTKVKSVLPSPQEPSGVQSPSHRSSVAASALAEGSKEVEKETLEEIRKKLEQDKKATEEAAKRSFQTMFYTLENDRDAMLDQQRLEESERQVEAEMSGPANAGNSSAGAGPGGFGSLSSANLGASSLTLKNLIARIDMKRSMVQASDAELRSLMSEVRKNRSKWASEDKIGQEELYEAAEKVLSELKAMTEHSTAFLTRVNKRDAPDYYNIIKHPMDLGTMTKKLKAYQYKSKQDFVDDLNLIWSNCLKYNTNPEHFLRKHALYMRKETEKLVPLIPDIVIRDRAEVEAEERRMQLAEMDGAEESDDEPIMSSRGRKAPGKTSKKGAAPARSTPTSTDGPVGSTASQPSNLVRADSDVAMEGVQNGFATPPPPGTQTPSDPAGIGTAVPEGQADSVDIDGLRLSSTALSALSASGAELEDQEYKIWKQVTKKDRALIAAERHRLFNGDKINPDEPALLRTRAGMRRWLKNQKQYKVEGDRPRGNSTSDALEPEAGRETLAEGIEEEEDKVIPDYYDVLSGIPDLPEQLHWREDAEGNVIDASEEFLRILPKGSFTQPDSKLSRKMDANMRQMQETRKICSKIGVVKQMQLQSQMYSNQFHKYQPEPFTEQDVPTHVMNDEGPVMAPWVCKAALQRSVAKIFYHAGFEEYQPSALDAVTDIASDFFRKVGETMKSYLETPKVLATIPTDGASAEEEWKSAYTEQEAILHTLSCVGTDVEALESYVRDDIERLGTKLATVHDRLKSLLTEMLRPALDGGEDGSYAFADGSEQFVGGDFAEDIDEDFFGFRELGLDKEFGLASLSVPLHLLQNRMYNAAQAQNTNASQIIDLFPTPPPYPRVTVESLPLQIGLIQEFFRAKLQANNDEPLVEDLELPPKQRPMAVKPRLPASGRIAPPTGTNTNTSPQKRAAPSTALATTGASKLGLGEPSKKKAKKNSGVGVNVSEPNLDGDGMARAGALKKSAADGSVTDLNLADAVMDDGPIQENGLDGAKDALPDAGNANNSHVESSALNGALNPQGHSKAGADNIRLTNGSAGKS